MVEFIFRKVPCFQQDDNIYLTSKNTNSIVKEILIKFTKKDTGVNN